MNPQNRRYQLKQGVAAKGGLAVLSALLSRATLASRLGRQFGGKRDLYDAFGYKKELNFDDYFMKYDRQDIAGRIVEAPAVGTWNCPLGHQLVVEDDDFSKDTSFEEAWKEFSTRLRVLHYLQRVDVLAGLGRYAVLVIGIRNGGAMDQPLKRGSVKRPEDIIYLSVFSEKSAEIKEWETNSNDENYGRPKIYEIDFANPEARKWGFSVSKQRVHFSRVIHVAEGLLEDDVFGRPRLKRVMNRLEDVEKVAGGGAEAFWLNAYRGLHANLDENVDLDPKQEKELSAEIDEYIHGLRRVIRTQGMQLKELGGHVADPRGVFETLLALISSATSIPKRILLGAERGELASTQDEVNWNTYLKRRQEQFAEPVLRSLIDRLIWLGALPEPKDGYKVNWPNLFELSAKEKAEIANTMATAIRNYAPFGETDRVVSPSEFREKILGLEPEHPDLRKDEDGDSELEEATEVDPEFLEQAGRRPRGNSAQEDSQWPAPAEGV